MRAYICKFTHIQNLPASILFLAARASVLMVSKEKSVNLFIAVLAPFAIASVVWAVLGIPASRIDSGVITVAALTIFCSCYLRIQLPRVNIHLTISDALVMLAMILYGGEIAVDPGRARNGGRRFKSSP